MKEKPVSLRALIDAIEWGSDFSRTFYWKSGNEFIYIDDDIERWVEDDLDINDAPEWMQQSIRHAIAMERSHSNDYYALPEGFEINEYDMMERFIRGMSDDGQAMQLADAIRGRGAFRRFRVRVSYLGLLDQWYRFKDECYKKIAISWCDRYEIPYEDNIM